MLGRLDDEFPFLLGGQAKHFRVRTVKLQGVCLFNAVGQLDMFARLLSLVSHFSNNMRYKR